jgi:phosphopantothenoylcysteine decarboxylase/phosphopantothenate--cysteine ligase
MNVMAKELVAASMTGPRILLVVGGGIAAYKSCELVRLIRKGGGEVTCVLTDGGAQFVTAMSLAALSGNQVHSTLWDLKNEAEIGHIELSRSADLVVVCPATADLLAKMAAGIADDLGTTLILATDKPVLAVPAMNVKMWEHEATQRNVTWLKKAGVRVMQPDEGEMACGEFGPGRLPEPEAVWLEIADMLGIDPGDARADEIGAFLRAQAEAEYVDPEEDDEDFEEIGEIEETEAEPAPPPRHGGLGSLIASFIPRSTARKVQQDEVV